MHPSDHAVTTPDKPAFIMARTGIAVTYGQLDTRSNQIAHLLRSLGLQKGDVAALMMENNPRFFEIAWAIQRAGMYFVCIASRLTPDEVEYILRDSGSKAFITSRALEQTASPLAEKISDLQLLMADGAVAPYRDLDILAADQPETPIADQASGSDILYSSGTTGKPKGIKFPLSPDAPIDTPDAMETMGKRSYGLSDNTVYLSPAPLYHAAPLRWSMGVQRLGGTVIVMEKFDAEETLALIERHRVTHAQFVPTHFSRMLQLPLEVRDKYSRPALEVAIHSAAPCPVQVKEAMIDWWGPILMEYYGATETHGVTLIRTPDWLSHRGSVGQAIFGELHICDENGDEVPPRTIGTVYFGGGLPINYHNDPEKSAAAYNRHGWATVGDIGWADEEGFLYLTDRQSFMIISGGVNIYPQEIENLFSAHPEVADVAVFGAPDPDLGERVVAVIEPLAPDVDEARLRDDLLEYAGRSLSRIKMPKQIDFRKELPREPTGKLLKRLLKDEYAAAAKAN